MASGSLQAASPERRREIAILGGLASGKTRKFNKFVLNWVCGKQWLIARIRQEYEAQQQRSIEA